MRGHCYIGFFLAVWPGAPAIAEVAAPAPASSPSDPAERATQVRRAAWLRGPLRGHCCAQTVHPGGAGHIAPDASAASGYTLVLDQDLRMRCALSWSATGHPVALSSCHMPAPWRVLSERIALHCTEGEQQVRCSGDYRVANDRESGTDTVVIERRRVPDERVPTTPEQRLLREASWMRGPIALRYSADSAWWARIRAQGDAYQIHFQPLSNLVRCQLSIGPDGDPTALSACVDEAEPSWRLVRRATPLHCERSERQVRCSGELSWRDASRTFAVKVQLVHTPRPVQPDGAAPARAKPAAEGP